MRLPKVLYLLMVLLWLLSLASTEARAQRPYVAYDQGLLSVSLENAELQEVLEVIETGISVRLPENLSESITVNFDRLPLEKGLNLILRDINHALIFSSSKTGKETVSGVYIPSDKVTAKRAPGTIRSVPKRTRPEDEGEDNLDEEEILGNVREYTVEQEEDAVLDSYERELDLLEQQIEMVGEDSPQGKAIMSRIQRLETKIEQRLQELKKQESP
jgi:hypothetical protein